MLLGASDPATRLRLRRRRRRRRRRREGPYDPTTVTSMKTLLKNRLPILLIKRFRDYPNSPCYLKEENFGCS